VTTYHKTFVLRPPSWLARIWYRRLGVTPPLAENRSWDDVFRLAPYGWRWFHRAVAESGGFFWLPCPLCDWPFGGHESGGTVPDPTKEPTESGSYGVMICSQCTRDRAAKGLPT
jgi:hypothetical protein